MRSLLTDCVPENREIPSEKVTRETQPSSRCRRPLDEDRTSHDGTAEKQPSTRNGTGRRRARYVDSSGREHTKAFKIKAHAQTWLDTQTTAVVSGTHLPPRAANMTVAAWCDWWLDAYKRKGFAKNTIQCANATVKTMVAEQLHRSSLRKFAV